MRTYYLLHHLLHYRKNTRLLPAIYSIFTVRAVLFTFLSIFLPIFYYQKFIQIFPRQNEALAAVFICFAVMHFLHIVSGYWAGKTAYRYGVRTNLISATLLLLAYIVLISFFEGLTAILLSIVMLGLHIGFWWHTYHLIMLHADEQKHFGRDWGILEGLAILVGVVTPLIAGSIAQRYGFRGLFSGSIFIVLVLFTLVTLLRFTYRTLPITIELVAAELKAHKREFAAFMGAGMEIAVLENIWPLVLFILFKKLVAVGMVASLVALIGFVFALLAGRLTDKLPKDKLQHVGSLCVAITWIARLLWPNPLSAIFWDLWHRTLGSFFYIPLTVISYLSALQKNDNAYFFVRELGYNSAKSIMMLLCAFLVYRGVSIWWLLIFGVVGPFLSLALLRIPRSRRFQ